MNRSWMWLGLWFCELVLDLLGVFTGFISLWPLPLDALANVPAMLSWVCLKMAIYWGLIPYFLDESNESKMDGEIPLNPGKPISPIWGGSRWNSAIFWEETLPLMPRMEVEICLLLDYFGGSSGRLQPRRIMAAEAVVRGGENPRQGQLMNAFKTHMVAEIFWDFDPEDCDFRVLMSFGYWMYWMIWKLARISWT